MEDLIFILQGEIAYNDENLLSKKISDKDVNNICEKILKQMAL